MNIIERNIYYKRKDIMKRIDKKRLPTKASTL